MTHDSVPYLDNAATTPLDPRVLEAMLRCLVPDGIFANPASRSHLYGWQAEELVENTRQELAELLGADLREIVWTSGATESNNLAIKGLALARQGRGRHLVSSAIEHKAVLDTLAWLEKQGFEVTLVAPESNGQVNPQTIADALRDDTLLVSVMHANNETGVINDIATIGEICRQQGVIFHVDAAQTLGKIPIDLSHLAVDMMSFSAHKLYGPKGSGALFVRRGPGLYLEPQIHGGGHERGMRSGTLATHQIVGLGVAARLAEDSRESECEHIASLRDQLREGLMMLDDVHLNGQGAVLLPGHLNLGFAGVDGEMLMAALSGVAVSSGSACTSASMLPSHVLKAMGLADELSHASVRFSVGRFTTDNDIRCAIDRVTEAVVRLRAADK